MRNIHSTLYKKIGTGFIMNRIFVFLETCLSYHIFTRFTVALWATVVDRRSYGFTTTVLYVIVVDGVIEGYFYPQLST